MAEFKNFPNKANLASVWSLGFVSLFMDMSSELIHSLLPIFMLSTLGLTVASIGLIEGIVEGSAQILKLFSGALSDFFRKRKPLTLIGYGLSAMTKPFFPLANSLAFILLSRFLDRTGKAIREAPRDALLGDIAPSHMRGAVFGLRQSLDTAGAVAGPLLAMVGMMVLADDVRLVLWIGAPFAVIAFLILLFGVHEPARHKDAKAHAYSLRNFRDIGTNYWALLMIASLLSLARFSDAFLILKAKASGLPLAMIPVVMVVMNIVYAVASYPAGIYSDRAARKPVLSLGIMFLIVADLSLALANNLWTLFIGTILWGLHMGLSQGLLAAMVVDITPERLRGTAFGIFYCACGVAALISSVGAGLLWDHIGPAAIFLLGAVLSSVALLSLLFWRQKRH